MMDAPARTDTRDRFLGAIAERVDRDAVAEAHLFQPIKQGGIESGVAVVAVSEPKAPRPAHSESREPKAESLEHSESREPRAESLVVYTARYRLTLKGPDRGKWDFAIQAEADAPLVTVDKVVQGVQRRVGDAQGPERLSGDEFRAQLGA
jgi:hypothetical protein